VIVRSSSVSCGESPKHNYLGFTGIAAPSLLSLNKPLRDGVSQFQSQLSLIRTKAISSNRAYRIKPKYLTRAEYATTDYPSGNPNKFVVEYAANCRVTAIGVTNNGWQAASQLDLDLPQQVGITDIATTTLAVPGTPSTIAVDNSLNWNICFDNRGIAGTVQTIIIKDFQANNKAKLAAFVTSTVGGTEVYLYTSSSDTAPLPEGSF
jgi:hypothetical protein